MVVEILKEKQPGTGCMPTVLVTQETEAGIQGQSRQHRAIYSQKVYRGQERWLTGQSALTYTLKVPNLPKPKQS